MQGVLAWCSVRRASPALRGAVLLATLVGLLVAPAFAAVAPVWMPLPDCVCPSIAARTPVAILSPSSYSRERPAVFLVHSTSPAKMDLLDREVAKPQAGEVTPPPIQAEALVFDLTLPPEAYVPSIRAADSIPVRPWSLAFVLTVFWLLGTLFCLLRALARLLLLYSSARHARPTRGQDNVTAATVSLRESPAVSSPLTLGLFWPVILLPADWRNWPPDQRGWALRHELAHVRRRDFLAGLVAEAAACLCWFHPLVRWLAGRLRLEQEYAADAWVVSALSDPAEYVRCLARLALTRGRGRESLAPAFWRRRPEILRRIEMLRRNPNGHPPRLGRRAAWSITALAAAACLAIAGVGPLRSAANGQARAQSGRESPARATIDPLGDPLPAGALARLGTTRLRHDGDVAFVFFGSDGKTLLTAGQDNTIRLWNLADGKEVRRFVRPKPEAQPPQKGNRRLDVRDVSINRMMTEATNNGGGFCVAVSSDGKTLAAAGGNVVQLWDIETGKPLRQIRGTAGNLARLLFSPDGRTLAGRSANGTLLAWQVENGKEIRQLKPAQRPSNNRLVFRLRAGDLDSPGMAFTPEGKTLAAAMTDFEQETAIHSVKLWDLETGQVTRRVKAPDGVTVSAVALTPDGKLLAFGGRGVVHVCEAKTGKELHQLKSPDGSIRALIFSPDGKSLAVRSSNERVRLWDTASGKELRQLGDVEVSLPIATRAIVAGLAPTGSETRGVAISTDGGRIAAAAGNTVRVWETATGKEIPLLNGHRRAPSAMILSADGRTIVSWGADRVLRRWEAATGKNLGAFPSPAGTTLAAFSPDGRLVAQANTDGTVRLVDTATAEERHRVPRSRAIAGLTFSRDGRILAVHVDDNSIRLFDVARGTALRTIGVRPDAAPAGRQVVVIGRAARATGPGLAFSPDASLLVAPGAPGNVLVFLDVATGKEMRRITSAQPVSSFTFSPDGRILATENADRTVTLWEVASGKERARLGSPVAAGTPNNSMMGGVVFLANGAVGSIADSAGPVGVTFSPDGRALAVRGPDRSVRVWDVDAGKEIGRLEGHGGRIETVAFAPNGKSLASGAADTTILLWDVAGTLGNLAKPHPVELSSTRLEALWDDLADVHAGKAKRGVLVLADSPAQAVPFLSDRLKPMPHVDPEKIKAWLADLESGKYAVRQEAAANLLKTGEQALPALRKILASAPSLETRKRAEELVDRLTTGSLTVEQLRTVRAIEALERMGTADALRLLRALAAGGPGALPTRESQAALGRLVTLSP
jgi:WD40 repeat protein/beta-lactamase regulating signal transducer with metallopeptidase domain